MTRLAEQLESVLQRIGNIHGLTLSPERRIRSVGHMVVKDDEIAYIVDFKFHL